MTKAFLGGTCNGSPWRDELIEILKGMNSTVECYNPVVPVWDEIARQAEELAKQVSDYHVYVFTPRMTGVYAVAEVVHSAHVRPHGTIMCILESESSEPLKAEDYGKWMKDALINIGFSLRDNKIIFSDQQINSLQAVAQMVVSLGGMWAPDLETVAQILHEGVRSEPGRMEVKA